jgi:hypothetical protein
MSRYAKSYNMKQAASSPVTTFPVIQQVAAAHDGKGDDKTPPYIPKENLVLAQTSVPTGAFGGAGTAQYQIEFVVPRHLGKVIDSQLNFQLTFNTGSSGRQTVNIMPTTFFCDAIETLYNGQVIERVEREECHQETVQYLTDQELNQVADRLNIDASTGGLNSFDISGSVTKSFWLPMWANVLNSAQPYVRGFSGEWRYRLFLTPNIWATPTGVPNSNVTLDKVNNIYLYCTEAQLQPGVESALNNAHNSGCLYRTVIRNKWTKGESQLVGGQEYQQTLTAFNTDSAALCLYVKPNPRYPREYIQKLELGTKDDTTAYIQLRDAANGELTIQLPPNNVIDKTNLFVPFPSVFKNVTMLANPGQNIAGANPAAGSIQKFYLFPFCPSIQKVVDEGHVGGGYLLTGQERIVIQPSFTLNSPLTATGVAGAPTAGVQVCCVSYEYTKLSCQAGQAATRRTV